MRPRILVVLLCGCAEQAGAPLDAGADLADAAPTVDAACGDAVAPAPGFGAPAALSDPSHTAFDPAVAARDGAALVAWHEFVDGNPRVAYLVLRDGCPSTVRTIADGATRQLRPKVAATASGWAIAYEATLAGMGVVRAATLAPDGSLAGGPDTVGAPGYSIQVAAAGDQLAFAWTDGQAHHYALRGPSENVPATAVGTTLADTTLLNVPVIALAADGTLFLAHRDGPSSSDWEVLLAVRPPGGAFGAEVNVSQSPGLLSDDVAAAVEADGTLDLAWVDQNPFDVNSFDVAYASRAPSGAITPATFYAAQGLWTAGPSVVPGLAAAWRSGMTRGPLYFATPAAAPSQILGAAQASQVALAKAPGGALHLAFCDGGQASVVRYSWQR